MKPIVLPPPPPHRAALRRNTERPGRPGRPSKWPRLLRLRKSHKRVKAGPYKNEATAIAAASYFNAQMRERRPKDYRHFRFRGDGTFVVCRHVEV